MGSGAFGQAGVNSDHQGAKSFCQVQEGGNGINNQAAGSHHCWTDPQEDGDGKGSEG